MYSKAPERIIDLVEEIVGLYHPRLANSGIAVLMQDKATKKNGKVVLGKAEKFPEKFLPFTQGIHYDFLVTFADDEWQNLDMHQRRALVDHELCHLEYDENLAATLRAHDVEEFVEIIERYGLWQPDIRRMANAIQGQFDFALTKGRVGTLESVE